MRNQQSGRYGPDDRNGWEKQACCVYVTRQACFLHFLEQSVWKDGSAQGLSEKKTGRGNPLPISMNWNLQSSLPG